MIGGSGKILLFALVGNFLLCHEFCSAVKSFSQSNEFQIDTNKIRIETEREPSDLKTTDETAGGDAGEMPIDEINDNNTPPTITQTFNDVGVNAQVAMAQLVTCTSEKLIQQSLNNVRSSKVIGKTSVTWISEFNQYFDQNYYTSAKINPIKAGLDENPTILQQVTSSRARLNQIARIVMDCPEWCSQPIKIQQVLRGNLGRMYQYTQLLIVCPEQSNPTVSVSQWTDRPNTSSQRQDVYILNPVE